MLTINLARARALTAELVARYGRDYRYSDGKGQCWYVPTGDKPTGCGVGETLRMAGVSEKILQTMDTKGVGGIAIRSVAARGYLRNQDIRLTPDAESYLDIFQGRQDHGHTWGEAYDYAESSVPRNARV
jgi:hypothetical protein